MSTNNGRALRLLTSYPSLDYSKVLLFEAANQYQDRMCFRQETTAVYGPSRSSGVVSTPLTTYIDR